MKTWLLQEEATERAAEAAREATLQAATYTASASITAALLGALLGATATYIAREIQDRRARRIELNGLIMLLDIETALNERRMSIQLESPYVLVPHSYAPQTREWQLSHIRLAQLLKDEQLFKDLATYYEYARQQGEEVDAHRAAEKLPRLKEASDKVRPRLKGFRAESRWHRLKLLKRRENEEADVSS